jgi:hypothetical protein
MAFYNYAVYNSGVRYAGEDLQRRHMSIIKLNIRNLSVAAKIAKGQNIITKETANPNVPGNTAVLAAFAAKQTALEAANQAVLAAREAGRLATLAQTNAEYEWRGALTLLAAFTETATGGEAEKILTTGFDIREAGTPIPLPGAVENLMVKLNGFPGHSKITWKPISGADGYVIQGSVDPITATSWTEPVIATKASVNGNGAAPGQKYWYRVAAFNAAGQGPWSQPASRPVM